jgi:hypothetical protein
MRRDFFGQATRMQTWDGFMRKRSASYVDDARRGDQICSSGDVSRFPEILSELAAEKAP